MKLEETAILLIEFQNDFVSEEGALKETNLYQVIKENNVVENAKKLVEEARELGATIIHAPILVKPDYSEMRNLKGILAGAELEKVGAFKEGTWGAEIIGELKPKEKDFVVKGKKRLSAFAGTDLEVILRSQGIKSLVIGGFLTNLCVEQTARDAYDRDYEVIVLSDCTAAITEEEQKYPIEKIFPMLGRVMKSIEVIKELKE